MRLRSRGEMGRRGEVNRPTPAARSRDHSTESERSDRSRSEQAGEAHCGRMALQAEMVLENNGSNAEARAHAMDPKNSRTDGEDSEFRIFRRRDAEGVGR